MKSEFKFLVAGLDHDALNTLMLQFIANVEDIDGGLVLSAGWVEADETQTEAQDEQGQEGQETVVPELEGRGADSAGV